MTKDWRDRCIKDENGDYIEHGEKFDINWGTGEPVRFIVELLVRFIDEPQVRTPCGPSLAAALLGVVTGLILFYLLFL